MLELDNYAKHVFEEKKLTPEQARDKAIEILESVRFNRVELEKFMHPVDEIDIVLWDWIADVIKREDVVRSFAAQFQDGLAQAHHASSLFIRLDP